MAQNKNGRLSLQATIAGILLVGVGVGLLASAHWAIVTGNASPPSPFIFGFFGGVLIAAGGFLMAAGLALLLRG